MVYYCELNKTGWEHAAVNGHLLGLLAGAFPEESIQCWLSASHWEALPNKASVKNEVSVSFVDVIEPLQGNKVRWVTKLVSECGQIVRVFRRAAKDKPLVIFFSSASPLANLFITLLAGHWFGRQKAVVVMHGELQLLRVKKTKWIDKCYAWCLRRAFGRRLPNRRYLVLGEHIRTAAVRYGYLPENMVVAIPHPLPTLSNSGYIQPDKGMVFGHIGVAKRAKNSQLFFELAQVVSRNSGSDAASFSVAGMVLEELKPLKKEWIDHVAITGPLAPDGYIKACAEIRYAVFCYADEDYELIGSGAVMDAIALEIPIIAIKNNYFAALFDRSGIAPGILCQNFRELCEVVTRLVQEDGSAYRDLRRGIHQLKQTFDGPEIQEKFSKQMKEFIN